MTERVDAVVKYNERTKSLGQAKKQSDDDEAKAVKDAKFEAEKTSFLANIALFGKPSVAVKILSDEKKISYQDMREEIKRTEANMVKLEEQKKELREIDPSKNIDDVDDRFQKEVIKDVSDARVIAMEYLKDSDP